MNISIHIQRGAATALGVAVLAAPLRVIADDQLQLTEIVVTAQKRSENLQETPVAVTALSADVLTQRNIVTTQDLMQVTPGLQVSTQTAGDGGGSATFFLRGMGQQRSANGSEPAVGIYIDDIYYPSLEGSIFSILDLEQIEVLRGPQGTLFGRNTIGGAIRYTTKKPSDDFEASVTATGGSYGRNDITGTLNLPLGSLVDVRVTVGRLKSSGYVRQQDGAPDAGGVQTELGRVQVRVRPADNLLIDLTFQDSKQYVDGFAYNMPGPIVPGPLFPSWWNLNPTHAGNLYDNRFASQCTYCQAGTGANREFADTNTPSGTLIASWNVSEDLTVKSLTGWTRVKNEGYSDQDGSPLPIFEAYGDGFDSATSEELQINDKNFDGHFEWVGGLYYYHEHSKSNSDSSTTQAVPPPLPGIPLQFVGVGTTVPAPVTSLTTESYAAYVNGSYHLWDKFSLLGGFRFSEDDKHDTSVGFPDESGSFISKTWRYGAQYQWTDTLMTYATESTGFRAGGFNPPSTTTPTGFQAFQPEYDRSFEAGARMDFLDRRLRLNPTVFYNNWSGIQVQTVTPSPQGLLIFLENAGRAHTYGFELEADAKVTQDLLLFGNASVLRAHYDSVGSANGITVSSHFQRAPLLTYAVGGTHTYDLPHEAKLRSTLNWSWEASQHSTPTDGDSLVLPSYGLLNARLEYAAATHWSIAALGTNLLNKTNYIGGVNYSANVGSAHYDLGLPREWGISGRYSF